MEEVYVLIDGCCGGEIYAISVSFENIMILKKEVAEKTSHSLDDLYIYKIPLEKYIEDYLKGYIIV